MPIPIIDLFAGPGGLSEGFSSARARDGSSAFKIALSIEKDSIAHRTLSLRATYRLLKEGGNTDAYYDYIRGTLGRDAFLKIPKISEAMRHAMEEARCAELGKPELVSQVDRWIQAAISGQDDWVLIGGPPCQAYSLAGRSRRTNDNEFERDVKHFLYGYYLRMIRVYAPPIFVMENVKGMLSSTHRGNSVFSRMIEDLSQPAANLDYEIRSFTTDDTTGKALLPQDFVIRSEQYGVPQKRHRVILLGVRSDLAGRNHLLLRPRDPLTVDDVIGGMTRIRSGVSRRKAKTDEWWNIVCDTQRLLGGWKDESRDKILKCLQEALSCDPPDGTGLPFVSIASEKCAPRGLTSWLHDPILGGVIQHQARSHMASDLQRYLFASSYSKATGRAPKLRNFPKRLLPDHENVTTNDGSIPFEDRFRVQGSSSPSTTVVSHIAKDGHYYIHPDPTQCRSLTVREAARLQTFPDNYFFEGNRTQQYTQVGNAVPPFLARQLGDIVSALLNQQKNDSAQLLLGAKAA
jgi:DNA (cytosine-5)-methyltransferase 1